jgi:hypothetical protein
MTSARNSIVLVVATSLFAGCVLPSFDKVKGDAGSTSDSDAGDKPNALPGHACGLSDHLDRTCDACIRAHCCALAKDCGDGTQCGDDLLEPITPVAEFSTDFDALLGCMQTECDAACKVNLGCVGNYTWPKTSINTDLDVQVVDYAAGPGGPLEGVTVRACAAVDSGCLTGKIAEGTTDADGRVVLPNFPATFEGFYTFEGADYTPATAAWSEPVHRIGGFTQYMLLPFALSYFASVTGVHADPSEPFDPAVGHLIFRVQNCLPLRYLQAETPPMASAGGARVAFTPNEGATKVFYLEETGPVADNLTATTRQGLGGAFNLLPRNVTVNAIDVASGREIARGTVNIRPGAIGFVWLVPRSKR